RVDATSRRVRGVELEPVPVANARRLRRLIGRRGASPTEAAPGDSARHAGNLARELLDSAWMTAWLDGVGNDRRGTMERARARLYSETAPSSGPLGVDDLLPVLEHIEGDSASALEVEADYFVIALPL